MTWSIAKDYAAFNPAAEAMMVRAGWPYVLRRPPAVSKPLLVLADQTRSPALEGEFRAWAATPEATVIDAEALGAKVPGAVEPYSHLPHREDLLRCKWFAAAAQTPVAMYGAETFGGRTEYEWCWLFGPGGDRAMVMKERRREIRVVQRRWFFRRRTVTRQVNERVTLEVTESGVAERPYVHAFAIWDAAARHLGVHSPGGFFRPHQRGFDWRPYHVTARRHREQSSG